MRMLVCGLVLAGSAALVSDAPAQTRAALVASIDSLVAAEMKENGNVGVSIGIERGGELLVAKGYGHADLETGALATVETVYRIGSLTKQFTAAIVMRLVEEGRIALEDELTKFLPDYPTKGRKITIHHLLTHTSGIKSYTGLGPRFWNELGRMALTDEQMIGLFANEPFDFEPGARYRYNNSAYFLLGVIIGKVTGVRYHDYLDTRLLAPLGLEQTLYCDVERLVPKQAQGYEVAEGKLVNDAPIDMNTPGAAGAMCSTVLDLLEWRRALDGGKVVSPASVAKMTTGHVQSGAASQYGYGLGIGKLDDHRQVAHSGGINGFNSWMASYPDDRLTVVVLTNNREGKAVELGQALARLILAR